MTGTTAPIFLDLGDTTVNASQIKWVGMKEEKVYVEFITGGWINFDGITLGQFRTALDDAVKAAAPF